MTNPNNTNNDYNLIKDDIHAYLKKHEQKELLRFITCGSVDDGKSTLIGRLLYETRTVFKDHLLALKAEAKYKRTEEDIDFSLLIDGLQAEREQGITIDVAYRYFTTEKRKFIIADTPGHEQYTRNMVTGASNADLAVILIDARNGVLTQTKRHTFIVTLLGITHIIVAINKMDLVGYREDIFESIKRDYLSFIGELKSRDFLELLTRNLGEEDIIFVPISALKGDNVTEKSKNMLWYNGKTFLDYLETVNVNRGSKADGYFCFPVQYVNRLMTDFRGYCGNIVSGRVKVGDSITVLPSKVKTEVKDIISASDKTSVSEASSPMAVTIVTADEIDISRGDVIFGGDIMPTLSDTFDVFVVWMHNEPLTLNRVYDIKRATTKLTGYVEEIYYKVDVNTLEKKGGKALRMNEIAYCRVVFSNSIAFEPYWRNRTMGGFIFIDRITNNTVGAGMISSIGESRHVVWYEHKVSKMDRSKIKPHQPCIIWLTGLSGAGKSTIANELELRLNRMGIHTYILDGDNIRHGLNRDLGFSREDRRENIRRVAEVARLFVDAGLVVITSFISPFAEDRKYARSLVEDGEFIEVFVDAPLEVCRQRDPKGLYKKAEKGEILEFTGVSSPYEPPEFPEIHIKTDKLTVKESVDKVIRYLSEKEIL
ncbi:MAG: sulfate adenylyltransferase subunit CysN [Synergistetes bacterium]|nr:sulfate adenylyltransferase subunit CysN [Synergistota bacterium]